MKFEIGKEIYILDDIPFEERRVIDELVEFWQTGYEPCDLATHIDKLSGVWGSGTGSDFIRQVHKNLRTGKRRYASASEYKQFLEAVYSRQAQKEAVKREEYKRRVYERSTYDNHCWKCKEHISSDTNAKCLSCGRYICSSCGSCLCGSPNY